jgi:hypothetical protein
VGNLPVMAFDGPKVFRMDLALSKRTRILDRYALELKGEAFNLTNSVSFYHRRHGHQQHHVRPRHERHRALTRDPAVGAVRLLSRG